MQWGINKGVSPYDFGVNINGTWSNLGTISPAGVWQIPASKVSFTQTGTGAVQTTVDALLRADALDATEFGVKCDNSTNNTTAFNNLVAAAKSARKPVILPAGICRTDMIDFGTFVGQTQFEFYGQGQENGTTLKKITADGNPIIRLNTSTSIFYAGPFTVSNIKLDGIPGNTPAAIQMYNPVRSSFVNLTVANSIFGVAVYGGNSNNFDHLIAQNNQIGFYASTYTSSAGFEFPPNLYTLNEPILVDNTTYGCYWEKANNFFVNDFDIEGNGTTGTAASGGCYINGDATSVPSAGFNGLGAVFDHGWFEGNAGGQSLWLNGGRNSVSGTLFVANPNTTTDLYITDGNYYLQDSTFVNNKPGKNITEGAGVTTGNYIIGTSYRANTYDPAKTMIFSGNNALMNQAISSYRTIQSGSEGASLGTFIATGSTGGAVSIKPQASFTSYNFNLPTSAGTSGQLLTSAGGGASAMTWTSTGTSGAVLPFLDGANTWSAIQTFDAAIKLKSYTVATLPTCNAGAEGNVAYVTDATTPTYNAALVGGGAVKVPVFCDGSAWTSH